jgi:hypothetical protein
MKSYFWTETLFTVLRRTPIRVLIVADGKLSFKESEFGLTELLNALEGSSTLWERLVITTAHRMPLPVEKGAQIPGFRFDADPPSPSSPYPAFNINNYDQVWLFGYSGQDGKPLDKTELKEIDKFMGAGGGVFATGDHRDLGFAMCSQVPRVRSMRKWYFDPVPQGKLKAPDQDGPTRIDTLRQGRDKGFQFSDQSDDVPQEIRPKFFLNCDGKGAHPHPLLAYGDFAVTVLPDHMHEGECIIPAPNELTCTYSFDDHDDPKDEYPELLDIPARLSPEVVAISTSAGGYLTDEDNILPVEPRCYKVIVAYDGHLIERFDDGNRLKLGRVVVDASFHHFVNTNLNGTDSIDPSKKGLRDCLGNPTKDYIAIQQYYRNIVTWLCPPAAQVHYYLNLLLGIRYMSPLIEEIRPIQQITFKDILFAGTVTRKAIAERFSPTEASLCALALTSFLPPETRAAVEGLINPWQPHDPRCERLNMLFNSEVLLKAMLGSAMLAIALNLSEDPQKAGLDLDESKSPDRALHTFVAAGMKQGVDVLAQALTVSNEAVKGLTDTLIAFK